MTSPRPDRPDIHEALVARLSADLHPVRPLRPPATRLAAWLVLSTAVVVIAGVVGLRVDLDAQLRQPAYVLQAAVLLAGAAAAAMAALGSAVPGRDDARTGVWLAVALAGVAALLPFASASAGSLPPGFVPSNARCVACLALFGAPPLAALLAIVARGAPLDARTATACAGVAAFLVGAAAIRVACPIDDPVHLLAFHILPVAAWTAVATRLGVHWTARWQHAPIPRPLAR